jgi:FkbM family methyltransferase
MEHTIAIRGGTTDPICLAKVFINREYEAPAGVAPRVIVDAGANVGMATVYFARTWPDARILAIEPASDNFDLLQRNCAGLPNVTCIRAALWPVREALTLGSPNGEAWAYQVSPAGPGKPPAATVPVVTMDDVLAMLSPERIDLLKLDIEGSERELFGSGDRAWLGRVAHIVIELHDRLRPGSAKAFYSALADIDFAQELRGENLFVSLRQGIAAAPRSGRITAANNTPASPT